MNPLQKRRFWRSGLGKADLAERFCQHQYSYRLSTVSHCNVKAPVSLVVTGQLPRFQCSELSAADSEKPNIYTHLRDHPWYACALRILFG